jgi:hypothetical protein
VDDENATRLDIDALQISSGADDAKITDIIGFISHSRRP